MILSRLVSLFGLFSLINLIPQASYFKKYPMGIVNKSGNGPNHLFPNNRIYQKVKSYLPHMNINHLFRIASLPVLLYCKGHLKFIIKFGTNTNDNRTLIIQNIILPCQRNFEPFCATIEMSSREVINHIVQLWRFVWGPRRAALICL